MSNRRGEIPDDRALVAGHVARVGVLEDDGRIGAELPRGAHDGHRRTAAARVLGADVERELQAVGVEAGDVVDDDRVEARRGVGILVVRKVGAGHEQRAPALQNGAERVAQLARRGRLLPAHDERHDLDPRRDPQHERQLHLERVFARVSSRVVADNRRRLHQRLGAVAIDRRHAERRLEARSAKRRHPLEADKVRRPHQDDDVDRLLSQQAVRIGGHRARVHQPGVRRDQRDQMLGRARRVRRIGQVPIDGRAQRVGGSGIPAAGDRCLANAPARPSVRAGEIC